MKKLDVAVRIPLAASMILLGGCATIVARPADTFEIVSDVDARCRLTDRAGTRSAHVPGVVSADPRHGPAQLECTQEGFKPFNTVVDTGFNGAVVGNVIFGGVIGAAIDVGTGNHKRYPGHVFVVMEPESFENAAAREQWLAYREQKLAALREEHAPEPPHPSRDDPSLQ